MLAVFGAMQSPSFRGEFDWDALLSFEFKWLLDEPFMQLSYWWDVSTYAFFTVVFSAPYWGGGLPTTADCYVCSNSKLERIFLISNVFKNVFSNVSKIIF